MKSSTFAGVAIASLLNTVAGKELPPNDRQADKYISGAVHMEIMGIKMVSHTPLRRVVKTVLRKKQGRNQLC